jgi:hypothetical protein
MTVTKVVYHTWANNNEEIGIFENDIISYWFHKIFWFFFFLCPPSTVDILLIMLYFDYRRQVSHQISTRYHIIHVLINQKSRLNIYFNYLWTELNYSNQTELGTSYLCKLSKSIVESKFKREAAIVKWTSIENKLLKEKCGYLGKGPWTACWSTSRCIQFHMNRMRDCKNKGSAR